MIRSIKRLWRDAMKRPMVPGMLLVISVHVPSDPTRRTNGYGGVLPVPGPIATTSASNARAEPLLEQKRRDVRAARGRVLYADGRGPQKSTPRPAQKGQCPERRMVQGRSPATSPTS